MTEGKQEDLAAVLARRRALEGKKDEIIALATQLFDQFDQDDKQWPKSAQLQNLRTIAASTDSVLEVERFIQYQMGRSSTPIKSRFGQALLAKIQQLRDPNDPLLSIEKVRYFLGNLVRYATYKRAERDQPEAEEE